MKPYTHPNPDPAYVMRRYRHYILGEKARFNGMPRRGTEEWALMLETDRRKPLAQRGLIHYQRIVDEYLAAKRLMLASRVAP